MNATFNASVSTLVDDGWKDFSVMTSVASTHDSGLITSFDGTAQVIGNDTITEIVEGTAEDLFTEWEIPSSIKVNKGDVLPIEISGSEAEAVSDKLVWHSADESIAHVSESGVLTAVGYGKTTISATDGNKAVTAKVTVMQNATAVSFSDVEMVIGERTLIRPSFEPVSATETDLTYSMDKEGVIEINELGVMHALAEGSVIVTGTTAYGVSGQFTVTVAECIVTVTEKEVGPPETGAVSMVMTGIMLVAAGAAVTLRKRRRRI